MKSKPPEKVILSATSSSPGNSTASATGRGNGSSGNGSPRQRPPREADPRGTPKRPAGWRPKENILEIAATSGRFKTLGRALEAAGLTDTLREEGPFTLFAPTDEAFAKMPTAELSALLADKRKLHKLLSYHLVPGKVRAPRNQVPSPVTTFGGEQLEISVVPEDRGYRVSDARIVKTNMRASNGVIHAIDTVLTPR